MDHAFWHDKWDSNQIGFHQSGGNSLLVKHFAALGVSPDDRVFVPLCGKTRDIAWLMAQGCRVVGAELSETAVQQLFADMDLVPAVTQVRALTRYAALGVEVFVGDIFAIDADLLGAVDAVFDRAALVALPSEMRARYADHLMQITQIAPQLVVTFDYDQAQMTGPPFAISADEMRARYEQAYQIDLMETQDVVGGFKGTVPATESVWVLRRRA